MSAALAPPGLIPPDPAMQEAIGRRMLEAARESWDASSPAEREQDLDDVRWWLRMCHEAGYAVVPAGRASPSLPLASFAPPSLPSPITHADLTVLRDMLGEDTVLRRLAERPAQAASAGFLRAVLPVAPPLHHLVAVLALGRATAALALLFGEPLLIDVVLREARATLRAGAFDMSSLLGTPAGDSLLGTPAGDSLLGTPEAGQ